MMSIPAILTLLTIGVAVPLNWLVTLFLWRLSRSAPLVVVLRERAVAATALSLIVTVFGLVFLNNDLRPPPLDFESTKYVTRACLLATATIPAVYFLRLYWRARS